MFVSAIFNASRYLTDGGIETDLIYSGGFELPQFAAIDLCRSDSGRKGLEDYFRPFLDVAADKDIAFILESPTWRASRDWAEPLGYSLDELAGLNREAIFLMKALKAEYQARIPEVLISGCIGPRGDGYDPGQVMDADEAAEYHLFQAAIFAGEGVDLVTAITMTNVPEARGVAEAARRVELPCVISFTVETDGRLPDGMMLADAIAAVDGDGSGAPVHYMINCAHPSHFDHLLTSGEDWIGRIGGVRTNASKLSHAELDALDSLDAGDPEELGSLHAELAMRIPGLKVMGGCCGTDARHIACMAKSWEP